MFSLDLNTGPVLKMKGILFTFFGVRLKEEDTELPKSSCFVETYPSSYLDSANFM